MNKEQAYNPELYQESEIDCLEAHIERHFGKYDNVFHEILSPDIHVDIAIINPTPQRDYYTLITMGMGAHRMNVPDELCEYKLERAEMVICLPPDWPIQSQEEKDYWPLHWLKIMARLPGNHDTWLGWGHSVPAGEPFAENTDLCGMLLLAPGSFGDGAARCEMPDGSLVNFYQMVPLYQEEMDYKIQHGADALLEHLPEEALCVLDINRPNYGAATPPKKYALAPENVKELLENWDDAPGCIATDRITVDGCKVGYMYREEPNEEMPDSGWRFTVGDESDDYMDNPDNSGVYHLNTICNYDPEILPLLHAPCGTAYIRDENGTFQREAFTPRED